MGLLVVFVVGALLSEAFCYPDEWRTLVSRVFKPPEEPLTWFDDCNTKANSRDLLFNVLSDSRNRGNVGIIGGHQILIERAPYMASLRLNGTYHWCGASIIHEQFVLTAAHCIVPHREFKVLVGTDNVNGDGQLLEIEDMAIHENYNNKTMDYDVCLIKLKETVTFGPKVGRVLLAPDNLKVRVISPKLLQVEIPLVGKKKCRMMYAMHKHPVTARMICAGTRGHDSCQGDSGGPLTLGNVQVGLTSFGLGCGIMPGIYTKVSSVVGWIDEKLEMLQ